MTEKTGLQHVVLCEGFDDRSFWSGWLEHLGCTNLGKKASIDAWGRPLKGTGVYLFRTSAGSSVVVQPFHGRGNARKAASEYLEKQPHRPGRLILNLDSDASNGDGEAARDVVRGIVRHHRGTESEGDGVFDVDGVQVFWVIWESDDPNPTPGVPRQQTLERLVAASIQAAYSGRGSAVDDWLAAEPRAEVTTHKSYGYSYLAKWYVEHGADDFFRALWRDEAVAGQLRGRLEKTGAWQTVAGLVAD